MGLLAAVGSSACSSFSSAAAALIWSILCVFDFGENAMLMSCDELSSSGKLRVAVLMAFLAFLARFSSSLGCFSSARPRHR